MQIVSITATTYPYDRAHDLYQQYYRAGLKAICGQQGIRYVEASVSGSERLLRKLRTVRHSYKLQKVLRGGHQARVVDAVAGLFSKSDLFAPAPVGTYTALTDGGKQLVFCVDAHDGRYVYQQMLDPADLYFKTNYWPSHTYPEKVEPLPNLNPLVGSDLQYFRSFRDTPKSLDLFAFFRIWGGDDEVSGIEHNLNLIESLARVPCKKFLCAYLVAGDVERISKRLEAQGIEWTTEPLPYKKLWAQVASSRLNIVRLGMHECIPWRMTDVLAMGGCPVIDYGPRTLWPSPLVENQHYLNLDVPPGASASQDLADRVSRWLEDPSLISRVYTRNAEYFDRHLEPIQLGQFMMDRIRATLASS